MLAVDYGVSCESRAYYAASVYMALALAIYVAGVPCALVARLWANRQGEASSPTELARLDGPLATLTAKYSAQFYWVEFVEIYERLMMCGLGVFIFPHKPSMRVALILIYRSFKLWLWKYRPIVDRAHRDVSTLCHGYLSFVVILAVMELSATPPTELQRFVFSCFLFASFVVVIALARCVASRERLYGLVDAIERLEAFDADDFAAACASAPGARRLREAVFHVACAIVEDPTAPRFAYLKARLQPLAAAAASPWGGRLEVTAGAPPFAERLEARGGLASDRAALDAVFGRAQAAALVAGRGGDVGPGLAAA